MHDFVKILVINQGNVLHDKATISQSPEGALICAGSGEEGWLTTALASVGAERQDPAPHLGVRTRLSALLRGVGTLQGSRSRSQSRACGSAMGVYPSPELHSGLGSSAFL